MFRSGRDSRFGRPVMRCAKICTSSFKSRTTRERGKYPSFPTLGCGDTKKKMEERRPGGSGWGVEERETGGGKLTPRCDAHTHARSRQGHEQQVYYVTTKGAACYFTCIRLVLEDDRGTVVITAVVGDILQGLESIASFFPLTVFPPLTFFSSSSALSPPAPAP